MFIEIALSSRAYRQLQEYNGMFVIFVCYIYSQLPLCGVHVSQPSGASATCRHACFCLSRCPYTCGAANRRLCCFFSFLFFFRPLPRHLLEYAALDVKYLFRIYGSFGLQLTQ